MSGKESWARRFARKHSYTEMTKMRCSETISPAITPLFMKLQHRHGGERRTLETWDDRECQAMVEGNWENTHLCLPLTIAGLMRLAAN